MVPPKQIWTFQTVINKWEIGMLEANKKKKKSLLECVSYYVDPQPQKSEDALFPKKSLLLLDVVV